MGTNHRTKKQLLKEIENLYQKISELEKAVSKSKRGKNELKEREVLESIQEGVIVLNSNFKFTYWNKGMEQISNIRREEILGKVPWEIFPFLKGDIEDAMRKAIKGKESREIELKYTLSNGKKVWTTENYFPLKDTDDNIIGVVGIVEDITQRKRAEESLRESEERFRLAVSQAPFPIMIHAENGEVILINEVWSEITEYQKEDLPTIEEWTRKAYGKKKGIIKKDIDSLYAKKKRVDEGDYTIKTKSGKERIWEFSSTPLGKMSNGRRLVISMAHDHTERQKAEEKIKKSLYEKEILLKEIHHRVKNNMQVISSLINIQANRIKDKKIRETFQAAQNRVMSMALVHEKLYQSENLAEIDFKNYIERMSLHLMSTYRELSKKIKLKTELENIFLDITKAVPLGLITNELLTNSLQHAFPKKKKGEIKIKFNKKEKTYCLSIRDSGIGFPKDLDFRKAESMGMDLVNSLVTQINGKIELLRDKGTLFKVTFKE
jgi:PAS domain S-box-containing protein